MAAKTPFSFSQGSVSKDWDPNELRSCGARGTGIHAPPSLEGDIHPIFSNWILTNDHSEAELLWRELRQPLLLASRILETVGLPWLSEFCIDDIFRRGYPGPSQEGIPRTTPEVIARHHRASWATPRLVNAWLSTTDYELRHNLPRYVEWQLNESIFPSFGWVGYTCRHQRARGMSAADTPLRDHPDAVMIADEEAQKAGATSRFLTVLIMKEYVSKLYELQRLGRLGSEEYLFTAFMVAVTVLHELGHVIYWRDFRAWNRRMTEPYFGGDLEMELGDSFIASIFGGWIPVPIANEDKFRLRGTFEEGLAWKEHLSWDTHRTRPRYRTHLSIPVQYIARLFDGGSWRSLSKPENLIRPPLRKIPQPGKYGLVSTGKLLPSEGPHASSALADFIEDREGIHLCCRWKRRPAADFRIPLYRTGLLWDSGGGRRVFNMSRMMPAEPEVCDKVLTKVEIRVELPSSETALYTRLTGSEGVPSGGILIGLDNSGALGAALDLRMTTGVGLRLRVAKALDLPVRHVKLGPEHGDEGDTVGAIPGSCVLSAYARDVDGAGPALRLAISPG